MIKNSVLNLCFVFILIGCGDKVVDSNFTEIAHKEGIISFNLDSLTSHFNHYQVVKQADRDLLIMLTAFNNRFVVYDIETQEMVKSFEIKSDDKNLISIGSIPPSGFSYINSDSIILYDYYNQKIFLGNENGEKELLISLMKDFPSDIDHWGASFQGAEPLMLNDSTLSITGAVVAGKEPFMKNQKSDLYLNINTGNAWKETVYPSSYLPGNFYTTSRLRPKRTLDTRRGLIFYSFSNSDSIQVLDRQTGLRTSFFANHINALPFIETSDIAEYRRFEGGNNDSFIYQMTQGAFQGIFYNSYEDHIIRIGFEGVHKSRFDVEEYVNGYYNEKRILSFYNAKDYRFLGNVLVENVGYSFMFFDKGNFYMAEISQNKSEDELVFTKFKYPDF